MSTAKLAGCLLGQFEDLSHIAVDEVYLGVVGHPAHPIRQAEPGRAERGDDPRGGPAALRLPWAARTEWPSATNTLVSATVMPTSRPGGRQPRRRQPRRRGLRQRRHQPRSEPHRREPHRRRPVRRRRRRPGQADRRHPRRRQPHQCQPHRNDLGQHHLPRRIHQRRQQPLLTHSQPATTSHPGPEPPDPRHRHRIAAERPQPLRRTDN